MKSALAYLALALLAFPWWWRLLRILVADVAAAGAPPAHEDPRPRSSRARPRLPAALGAGWRVRASRPPTFPGIPRRAAVRPRWEGGFGRRSL